MKRGITSRRGGERTCGAKELRSNAKKLAKQIDHIARVLIFFVQNKLHVVGLVLRPITMGKQIKLYHRNHEEERGRVPHVRAVALGGVGDRQGMFIGLRELLRLSEEELEVLLDGQVDLGAQFLVLP